MLKDGNEIVEMKSCGIEFFSTASVNPSADKSVWS